MNPLLESDRREEFTSLLSSYLPDLYRLAHWLARDPSTAEDLVQEASLRAFRRFDNFEIGTNFKAWIFRILYNHFLDTHRRKKRHAHPTDFSEIEPEDKSNPEPVLHLTMDDLLAFEDHVDGAVAEAIEELPEAYRTVFLLFSLGDLTYEEISQTLEIPIGTVMSRLYRARQKLQEKLAEYATEKGFIRDS